MRPGCRPSSKATTTAPARAAAARRFVEAELTPNAERWDDDGIPREAFATGGAMGLIGARYPESIGGAGGDLLSAIPVVEEISRCRSGGFVDLLPRPGAHLHADHSPPRHGRAARGVPPTRPLRIAHRLPGGDGARRGLGRIGTEDDREAGRRRLGPERL